VTWPIGRRRACTPTPTPSAWPEILGDTPNGRLYRALVQPGLASQVFAYTINTREPGFVVFGAMVNKGDALDRVRDRMIEVIEGGFARQAATAAELGRAVEQAAHGLRAGTGRPRGLRGDAFRVHRARRLAAVLPRP
jgi:hypothetical protein